MADRGTGNEPSRLSPRRGSSSPAPPGSPARSRPSSSGATRGSSSAAATSRSRRRHAARRPHPRYRVAASSSTELDLDARRGFDAAIVAYPHGAAAPVVAGAARARRPVVDVSADFRLRDRRRLRALVRRARRARPARRRGLRAARAPPRPDRGRRAGRQPRLLSDRGAAGPGAAGEARPDRRRRRSTPKSGVSGAGRGGGQRLTSSTVTENFSPYRVGGHRHAPEIEQELAGLRRAAPTLTFVPHLLPLDQGLLASCYVRSTSDVEADELARSTDCYGDEPFVEVVDDAARRARRRATRTAAGSTSRKDGERRVAGLRRDRQPLEGRGRSGGPEPEPDAGPRGGGGLR